MFLEELNEAQATALQAYADTGMEEEKQRQKYPALQLNQYKGLAPNTQLFWCFAQESFALIPEGLREWFQFEELEAWYGDDKPVKIYKINADIRFVPLYIPRLFKENKVSGEISKLSTFIDGDRSIAKLFLIPVVDNQLLALESKFLIVTLKLRSFRTKEIIGDSEFDEGTLNKLSAELAKKGYGGKGKTNVHFVNLKITPGTSVYKSSKKGSGDSSRGVSYKLESAKLNTPEMMALISGGFTEELKKDILDPFGLDSKGKDGIIPQTEAHKLIKSEISDLAQQLGWNNARVKRAIMEQFGVSSSAELSVEQMLQLKEYMEGLASFQNYPEAELEDTF